MPRLAHTVASRYDRKANSPRNISASMMRKMQVPAYWPLFIGVHAAENSGVVVDVKNDIVISDMDIIDVMDVDDEEVDEAMAMLVVLAAMAVLVVILISIVAEGKKVFSAVGYCDSIRYVYWSMLGLSVRAHCYF